METVAKILIFICALIAAISFIYYFAKWMDIVYRLIDKYYPITDEGDEDNE